MPENKNQNGTQTNQTERKSINESISERKSIRGSGDAGGSERIKTGNAGGSTNNTGPRKTE